MITPVERRGVGPHYRWDLIEDEDTLRFQLRVEEVVREVTRQMRDAEESLIVDTVVQFLHANGYLTFEKWLASASLAGRVAASNYVEHTEESGSS